MHPLRQHSLDPSALRWSCRQDLQITTTAHQRATTAYAKTPVQALGRSTRPARGSNSSCNRFDWRAFYTDPRLAGVLELVLANNCDLRVSETDREIAVAQ